MNLPDVRRCGTQFRAVVARGDGTRWYGPRRDQAEVAAADAASFRLRGGRQRPGDDMPCTLAEAFALLIESLERSGARPATIRQHRERWSVITSDGTRKPMARGPQPVRGWNPAFPIAELAPDQVHRWSTARVAIGVSLSTIWSGDVMHLRSLVRVAMRAGRIKVDPLAGLVRPKFRQGRFGCLTAAQVRAIAAQVRDSSPRVGRRDAALIEFLFATGLRRAELARLRRLDLDFDARQVRVDGKTGNRALPLSDLAIAAARVLFDGRDPDAPCIPDVRTLEHVFQRASLRCGVRISPHMLRVSFATACAGAGVDPFTLSKLLGHTTLTQSLRYVHESGALSAAAVAGVGASYGHNHAPGADGA